MNGILIPMLVEAYASGKSRPSQKDVPVMAPNYKTALPTSVLGSRNTPGVNEKAVPLEGGVHLHFILPDAFTHSADGQDYPAVPNRYIVTRIWEDTASKKLCSKCFVVESNFITTDKACQNSITIPFFTDPDVRKKWRYLGRSYPADTLPSVGGPENYLDKITAMGAGDTLFAAYYPNCRSVFGFHDDLLDLPPSPSVKLTYFVAGYFSNGENDPFAKVKNSADFSVVLDSLNLTVTSEGDFSDNCILYGMIDSIEWKGFEADYCPVPQGKINIAIGNTSAEALSFAIKNDLVKDTALTERMLTALQYELYDEQDKPDGNFRIDDEIHFQSFARFDGFDEKSRLIVDKNASPVLDQSTVKEFQALQEAGGEIGSLKRALIFERKKLFSVWEQYIMLYEDGSAPADTDPSIEKMLEEVQSICGKINQISAAVQQKTTDYESRMKAFPQKLPKGFACEKSGRDAFCTAKDPVVLLSGPGVNRTYAFGEDGRLTSSGRLFCQMAALSGNVPQDEIFRKCFTDLSYIKNLLPAYAPLLLQTAFISTETFKVIKDNMGTITVSGSFPSEIAVNRNPLDFATLFMLWEIEYSPTRSGGNPDNTLEGWELEYGDTNLVYKGGLKPEQLKACSISGKIPLTPHAVKTFSSVVKRYSEIYEDDDELKKVAEKIKDLPIISQNLSGFSDYFSEFWQALQFPIMGIGEKAEITKAVADSVGSERQSILPSGELMPLRGGYIKIKNLSLSSTFGQLQPLVEASYYNDCEVGFAETMQNGNKDYGLLPPCFTAPARLNAEFVSALDNAVLTSVIPGSSPVCGILIPEILNNRLLAYTAVGEYLGMVKTVFRESRAAARWLSAPNLSPNFEDLNIPNPHLKKFLKALLDIDSAFYEFTGLLNTYLDSKHDFGSLLWGRPLVLARMRLDFEFYGFPQFSKRFEDFGKYSTCGAEKVRFSIRFGDMERISDGVLGCFNGDDFTKLLPPFGSVNPYSSEAYIKYSDSLELSNADGSRFFTLLLEPTSNSSIQTGLLPVKTVPFEPAHAETAENLALASEVAPILASFGQVGLPPLPPSGDNRSYKWYVPEGQSYLNSDMIPPMVSFDETELMDGLIVKDVF